MNKKYFLKFLLTIFVTALVLYFLFKGIHFSEIVKIFYFKWQIIVFTVPLFFVIKFINSLRFSRAYNTKLSKKLFYTLCYSNMMLSVFPFRLGELSYIARLQKITGEKYSETTSKLIKIRLFDYVSIYLLLMVSSIYVYAQFSNIIKIISVFFICSLIVGLLSLFVIIKLNLSKKIKFRKFSQILLTIENEVRGHARINYLRDLGVLLLSLLYWFVRLLMGYFVLVMLGIHLSFFTVVFISMSVFMLTLIPIQFFAGFGITEAGFLFFLTQLGFEYNSTLAVLLMFHLYLLIPVVFWGCFGFFLEYLRKRQRD